MVVTLNKSLQAVVLDVRTWLGDGTAEALRAAFEAMKTDLGKGMAEANAIIARLKRAQGYVENDPAPKGAA